MAVARTEFLFDKEKEPHRARTKEILKKYPEIRKLIGKKNPYSFLVILLAVSAQFGGAYLSSNLAWYFVVPLAYFVGTIINHTFIALVHDASHNLIFKNKPLNNLAGILVNSPMVVPSYVSFKKYHMKHHAFQGVYELDADFPSRWEAKWVRNIWYRKIIWLLFYPLIQSVRTARVSEVNFMDFWVILNWVVVFAADFLVWYFWGPTAFLYLFVAFWFGFGLSITGGRLIQEHYMIDEPQETYSYYGWLTWPSLHVGYHNEHHDFPSAPWNNLPKIRKIAPEYYESLTYHTSWTKIMLKFLFDSKMSLYDRVERNERGGVELNAEVRPDLDEAESKKASAEPALKKAS